MSNSNESTPKLPFTKEVKRFYRRLAYFSFDSPVPDNFSPSTASSDGGIASLTTQNFEGTSISDVVHERSITTQTSKGYSAPLEKQAETSEKLQQVADFLANNESSELVPAEGQQQLEYFPTEEDGAHFIPAATNVEEEQNIDTEKQEDIEQQKSTSKGAVPKKRKTTAAKGNRNTGRQKTDHEYNPEDYTFSYLRSGRKLLKPRLCSRKKETKRLVSEISEALKQVSILIEDRIDNPNPRKNLLCSSKQPQSRPSDRFINLDQIVENNNVQNTNTNSNNLGLENYNFKDEVLRSIQNLENSKDNNQELIRNKSQLEVATNKGFGNIHILENLPVNSTLRVIANNNLYVINPHRRRRTTNIFENFQFASDLQPQFERNSHRNTEPLPENENTAQRKPVERPSSSSGIAPTDDNPVRRNPPESRNILPVPGNNNENVNMTVRLDPTIFNSVPHFAGDNLTTVDSELQALHVCAQLAYDAFATQDEKSLFLRFLPTKLRGKAALVAANQRFNSVNDFITFLKSKFIRAETYADLSHEIRYMTQQPQESIIAYYNRVEEHYEKCRNRCQVDNPQVWEALMGEFDKVAATAFKMGITNPNHKYKLLASKEKRFTGLRDKVERLERTDDNMFKPSLALNVPASASNCHIFTNPHQPPHSCSGNHPCTSNTTPNVGNSTNNQPRQRNINQISRDNRANDRRRSSPPRNHNSTNRNNFDSRRNDNAQCDFCGRRGHYVNECRQKRNTPFCNLCKVYGHLQSFCERQRNRGQGTQYPNPARSNTFNRNGPPQNSRPSNYQNGTRNSSYNNYRDPPNSAPRNTRQENNTRNEQPRQVHMTQVEGNAVSNQRRECEFCTDGDHNGAVCPIQERLARMLEVQHSNVSRPENS